jgi:hypothetical protein
MAEAGVVRQPDVAEFVTILADPTIHRLTPDRELACDGRCLAEFYGDSIHPVEPPFPAKDLCPGCFPDEAKEAAELAATFANQQPSDLYCLTCRAGFLTSDEAFLHQCGE